MFTNNVEYTYEFNGMTIINPPTGNNENNSELKIKGTVKVAGIQNCGAIVDLLNVEITQGSEVFYFFNNYFSTHNMIYMIGRCATLYVHTILDYMMNRDLI